MKLIEYFKSSSRELRHVVWPTHKETKKYMIIVTTTIILSTIFLYILSLIFENSFFALRSMVSDTPAPIVTNDIQVNTSDESWNVTVETLPLDTTTDDTESNDVIQIDNNDWVTINVDSSADTSDE